MSGRDRRADEATRGLVARMIADRYELGRMLGQGGMGEVRAGIDRRLGRPVAVKVLRGDLAGDPGVRARFEREAQAAARLVHPHVVAVFDTGEEDGVPYLVMERLPGLTLADRIAEGPLPPDEARRVGGEVLSALLAAHDARIIHRDVKPGNVLLAADGTWKVADFGIAKSIDAAGDLTVTGALIGTPAYVAPERLEGEPASPASDLYSVGVLLYEALSGRKPFTAESPVALADAIRAQSPTPLLELCPGIDPSLAALVHRAIERDPHSRFTSAAEMLDALAHGDSSTAATTVPDVRRSAAGSTRVMTTLPPRRALSRSRGAALAAGVVLTLGLATAVVLTRDGDGGGGGVLRDTEPAQSTIAPAAGDVTVTGEPLPPEYRRALDELEEAVRP